MLKRFAILAALGLSGCAAQAPAQQSSPLPAAFYTDFRELTPAEKLFLSKILSESFKDPGSVQLRWTKITRSIETEPQVFYCAMVNAKNSYDGYIGFGPYWAYVFSSGGKITGAKLLGSGSDDLAVRVIGNECRQRGIDPMVAS